jgi:hypothetical protein
VDSTAPRASAVRPLVVTPAAVFPPARPVPGPPARPARKPLAGPAWSPPARPVPGRAVAGVTQTQVSYEVALGPLKFGATRQSAPDSMEITWPNGASIKVTGAALVTEVWRQFQEQGGITRLGGYNSR